MLPRLRTCRANRATHATDVIWGIFIELQLYIIAAS
jgi:hypothetical protein